MTVDRQRTVILTVGYIHSGKTSFARRLMAELPDLVCLERDPIATMLHNDFPAIKRMDMANRNVGKQTVKDKIYELMLSEMIDSDVDILISACNSTRQTRKEIIDRYKTHIPHARFIIVYFDIDMAVLERRVQDSIRSTDALTVSKTFAESLNNQKKFFEIPTTDEADVFLTIRNNENTDEIISQIASLLAQN